MALPRGPRLTARARAAVGLALCLLAGAGFLGTLGRLWPLAPLELAARDAALDARAAEVLRTSGFDVAGHVAARWTTVDAPALDYVERAFGTDGALERIAAGLPLYSHLVGFKRSGEATTCTVAFHPSGRLLGWAVRLEDDAPGAALPAERARALALAALADRLGLDPGAVEERSSSSERLPDRLDHRFVFERSLSSSPELRERVRVEVAGDRVTLAWRALDVPAAAERAARAAEAPGVALETAGFLLLAVGGLGAFVVFLRRLRGGALPLGRAACWPATVFVCFSAAGALDAARLFRAWDPLWPRAVSAFRSLAIDGLGQVWVLLVLLAVVAAGDALDRDRGGERGAALWKLARGRLLDPSVAAASRRGFLIGLACGGVMAAAVVLLQELFGARSSIQPRGFFFYPLNSAAPAATSLLFFWGVALTEELGYRFFGGSWLLRLTRRGWIAVLAPALVYGLTHTRLDFLPPAEPFWGRAVVLTLVGCVWGWAFLRFDALTVVLSHYTADLFIFNWPRLAGGEPRSVAIAVLTVAVPLVPALLQPLARARRRSDPPPRVDSTLSRPAP